MIRALLREYCTARSCHHHGPEAEDAARRLVVLYQDGIDDGDELRRLLPQPNERRSPVETDGDRLSCRYRSAAGNRAFVKS